jgi:NAD+ synthase (glutamine-hydrolysing)
MLITTHQTHHQVADFDKIFETVRSIMQNASKGIHVFPELFLTGYPLQDLCLQKSFIQKYNQLLEKINKWAKEEFIQKDTVLLLGGLEYELTSNGIPVDIQNVIFSLEAKGCLTSIYSKKLLPNYDIFDEQKYFTKGAKEGLWKWKDKNFGLLICEDMWASSFHHIDPVEELKTLVEHKKVQLDGVINLSASPYVIEKPKKRYNRGKYIAKYFKCPFFYTNRVGGEDEILFDGQSFICDGNNVLRQGNAFEKDSFSFDLTSKMDFEGELLSQKENTWEALFNARIENQNNSQRPLLTNWTDQTCEDVLSALKFGLQEYASKSGFNNFTIALSGGIDSSLVLTIMRLALKEGQYLEAIYMPSIHSSPLSYDLSLNLCKNLGVPMKSLPIKFLHSTTKNLFTSTFEQPFEGITDENIQSRLRGTLLYTRSNQINSMVVNTSNKSELAVGYSTQYGDSVGAISLLGDLYKTQVYRLSQYINDHYQQLIPQQIIDRAPSAELRPDQVDSQSLPPYERLDAILEGILSYRYHKDDLIQQGFDAIEVNKVLNLYRKTEYKRYQFCPIIKISSKSFGFGYRIPISKSSKFYTDDL